MNVESGCVNSLLSGRVLSINSGRGGGNHRKMQDRAREYVKHTMDDARMWAHSDFVDHSLIMSDQSTRKTGCQHRFMNLGGSMVDLAQNRENQIPQINKFD